MIDSSMGGEFFSKTDKANFLNSYAVLSCEYFSYRSRVDYLVLLRDLYPVLETEFTWQTHPYIAGSSRFLQIVFHQFLTRFYLNFCFDFRPFGQVYKAAVTTAASAIPLRTSAISHCIGILSRASASISSSTRWGGLCTRMMTRRSLD